VLTSPRWFAGLQGDDPESVGTLFGNKFAHLHGAAFALPVANGSVAIEIGLKALGVKPGDEVIVRLTRSSPRPPPCSWWAPSLCSQTLDPAS